jgi:hypothetical protein
MSISSCPRCAGQVTLPIGASNSAKVRCPLCHAHYSLADALVNMPPLLEVVEDAGEAVPPAWHNAPEQAAGAAASSAAADELTFEAAEADDEELALQDEDTEIEDLAFSTFDSTSSTPGEVESAAAAQPQDDSVLDFGEPLADAAAGDAAAADDGDEEMTLEFGAEELSEEVSEGETLEVGEPLPADAQIDDDVRFDLDQPETVADTDATIDFSDAPSIRADDEVKFDLDATADTVAAGTLGEFGDLHVDASGDAEDIPLDLPDEPLPAAAQGDDEPPATKKGKKKQKKAAGEKPKRSWAGVALTSAISLPIVLYVALWAGFDPIGLAGYLPGFMVPAGMNKQIARNRPYTPTQAPETTAEEPQAGPEEPSGEHTAARPTTPDGQPAEGEMPADEPPSLDPGQPPLGDQPAGTPSEQPESAPPESAAPSDDSLPNLDAPADSPLEMPAEGADAPADDPFGQPEAPADESAPVLPAEPSSEPVTPADDSSPFDAPKKDAMPAAADPFAPANDEKPAPADDPFAPANDEKPAPADDPFAPANDEKPAPADDPFAPAKDEKPAADDPFAPAPKETPPEPSAPADAEPLPVPDEPARLIEPLGPRNPQVMTAADLNGAMQATMAASQQMVAAQGAGDEAQLRKARANFYVAMFGMANAITLVQLGPAGPQLNPQLRALEPVILEQLAADPRQVELLKVFGARWFAFPKRTTNGVVLAGTVESVDQVGPLYHAKVRQGPAAGSVTIVCAKDPRLEIDDEVLTLGSIVEQPQDQLAGYEGSEPAVVWSGMTLKIPPAAK